MRLRPSARLLDLLDADHDAADDVRRIEWIVEAATPIPIRTVLDVGCGTGRHLAELQRELAVEGLDIDAAVLAVARERARGAPLHRADMTGFDLGRRFDAVLCLGSAIGYATTISKLRETISTFARHTNQGGVVVVVPWVFRDDWVIGHVDAEVVDLPDLKIARFRIGGLAGGVSTLDVHYLVATPGGAEAFSERHRLGLFTDEEYRAAFAAAGLAVSYLPDGLVDSDLYVGVRGARPDDASTEYP